MEETYIIGDSNNIKKLNLEVINFPNDSDLDIHHFVLSIFEEFDINKLVIEIDKYPEKALKIAYHIRLSLPDLREKALTPIVFVSLNSVEQFFFNSTTVLSYIIATDGVAFCSYSSVLDESKYIEALLPERYKARFLDLIKILPDEKVGRHSLANVWGAFSIDSISKLNILKSAREFDKNITNLYFKSIIAQNFDYNLLKKSSLKQVTKIDLDSTSKSYMIEANSKRILLIDDEANKGWKQVLSRIFKISSNDDFVVIDENIEYYEKFSNKSKDIIENTDFDLYLVDLRLNGIEEDQVTNTNAFSGMSVLKKIKSLNQGNQVIIITASNKAWNLKKLLEGGADGYYVKESPEYNFSEFIINQNYFEFKQVIMECFQKKFLKELDGIHKQMITYLKTSDYDDNEAFETFIKTISVQLNLSYSNTMKIKLRDSNSFDIAFLSLFNILEIIVEYYVIYNKRDYLYQIGRNPNDQEDFYYYVPHFNKKNCSVTRIEKIGIYAEKKEPSIFNKITAIMVDYFNLVTTKDKTLFDIQKMICRRNNFIHSDVRHFKEEDIISLTRILKVIVMNIVE